MKQSISGKKLLILGANPETSPLIQVAKDLGVYTIVTDNNPSAPAKSIADKRCDVDGTDVEGLVRLAKAEKVDGILVGVADVLVGPYREVCDRLRLPCYASQKSVSVLSNKDEFKRTCEEFGVSGVPDYGGRYPAIVKPVDSCSGQGMTICNNDEELAVAIEDAESVSRSGQFIIERYMTCDDTLLYYTFVDGECYLSATADRFTLKGGRGSPVNLGSVYPSKHTDLYLAAVHEKMKKMFRHLGIQNGVLLIQAFVENSEFYVYDPGFRLQGESPHILLKAINGFDHREMLINFAFSGDMGEPNFSSKNDHALRGKSAATVWILLPAGRIERIEGLANIEDARVIQVMQRLGEGDVVTDEMVGTEKQVFARICIVCDTKTEVESLSADLRNRIRVTLTKVSR